MQDPTLLHQVVTLEGIRPDGYVLVNSSHNVDELGLDDLAARHGLPAAHLLAVPATEIARRTLGHPLPNTALLGAFAAAFDCRWSCPRPQTTLTGAALDSKARIGG